MSITRRIFFGAAASWFSRGVTIVLGLVLLPVLFRHLPKEELGVWLLLGQSAAALGVLDFGFGVTLTRRIAFAVARRGGAEKPDPTNEVANLVATGRVVYSWLAVGTFVISLTSGYFYLRSLNAGTVPVVSIWGAWSLLCLSQALSVWANRWTCLLQGVGYVGWDSVLASLSGAVTMTAQIVAVFLGGGLLSLSMIAAVGAIAQRSLVLGFIRSRRPGLFSLTGTYDKATVRQMMPLAFRAWITALGVALVLYTDQFVIASLSAVEHVSDYRAMYVLVHNITIVAVAFGAASSVFVSQMWQAGDLEKVNGLLCKNVRLGWSMMLIGAAFLLTFAEPLFDIWLGAGHFAGYSVLIIFLITEALEMQSFIVSSTSRATEDEAFALSTILAGGLKLALSLWLGVRYGLLGVALGTALALGLTNHWYMVWRGLRRLRFPIRAYLFDVIVPGVSIFFMSYAVMRGVKYSSTYWSPVLQLVMASFIAALGLLMATWFLVLDERQRRKVVAHLFRQGDR